MSEGVYNICMALCDVIEESLIAICNNKNVADELETKYRGC